MKKEFQWVSGQCGSKPNPGFQMVISLAHRMTDSAPMARMGRVQRSGALPTRVEGELPGGLRCASATAHTGCHLVTVPFLQRLVLPQQTFPSTPENPALIAASRESLGRWLLALRNAVCGAGPRRARAPSSLLWGRSCTPQGSPQPEQPTVPGLGGQRTKDVTTTSPTVASSPAQPSGPCSWPPELGHWA